MWFLFISFVTQTKFPKIHCSAQSARLFLTIYIFMCFSSEKQHVSNEFYSLKNIGHKLISVQRNWMKYRCLRLAVAIYCTRLCIIFACVVCQQVINVISKSQFFCIFLVPPSWLEQFLHQVEHFVSRMSKQPLKNLILIVKYGEHAVSFGIKAKQIK